MDIEQVLRLSHMDNMALEVVTSGKSRDGKILPMHNKNSQH